MFDYIPNEYIFFTSNQNKLWKFAFFLCILIFYKVYWNFYDWSYISAEKIKKHERFFKFYQTLQKNNLGWEKYKIMSCFFWTYSEITNKILNARRIFNKFPIYFINTVLSIDTIFCLIKVSLFVRIPRVNSKFL